MLEIVNPFMQQVMEDMHQLFDGCLQGTTRYRNDNEPHLVKYTGEDHKGIKAHRGVCMHTDSADITINVALSDPQDFTLGGTYFEAINKVRVLRYYSSSSASVSDFQPAALCDSRPSCFNKAK